jgi:hypothetical protein
MNLPKFFAVLAATVSMAVGAQAQTTAREQAFADAALAADYRSAAEYDRSVADTDLSALGTAYMYAWDAAMSYDSVLSPGDHDLIVGYLAGASYNIGLAYDKLGSGAGNFGAAWDAAVFDVWAGWYWYDKGVDLSPPDPDDVDFSIASTKFVGGGGEVGAKSCFIMASERAYTASSYCGTGMDAIAAIYSVLSGY